MKKVLTRIVAILPAVVIQIIWYLTLYRWLKTWSTLITVLLSLLAVVFVLFIFMKEDDGTYKTLWLLVILALPITGTVLYLMFGNKRTTRSLGRRLDNIVAQMPKTEDSSIIEEIEPIRLRQTFQTVEDLSGFPTVHNEEARYYHLGEEAFPVMLDALRQAKKFIFVEYFIIDRGVMWDSMVEIMAEKVKEGVDVRVMYDDVGSISTYSKKDADELRAKGIQCIAFNQLRFITASLNSRDHRKMLIIDNEIAFSGGINLADEYINAKVKYGHWKDIAFYVKGEPVKVYTRMFAHFWNAGTANKVPTEYIENIRSKDDAHEGYVLSYYDSPIKNYNISNELYVDLLSQAKEKAYFYTPYLMLGDSLMEAFQRAATRGVDVRIIMPGIPDKKLVFRMSRSYYEPLLNKGVKIYEYTPGFNHAKAAVIDGEVATIGTVNLDYRSLFLHFENNSLFYKAPIVQSVEEDFLATQAMCKEMTIGDGVKRNLLNWFIDGVLRIFAPLC